MRKIRVNEHGTIVYDSEGRLDKVSSVFTSMAEIIEIRVLHSDLNTYYKMTARIDRLAAFTASALSTPPNPERDDWAMGIAGGAVVGLNALITHIPNKFPMLDLLKFLREWTESESMTLAQVEYHLGLIGQRYPGIDGEGNDV